MLVTQHERTCSLAPGKRFLTAFPNGVGVSASATPSETRHALSSPHSASFTPCATAAFPTGFGHPQPMAMVNQWGSISTSSPLNSPRKMTSSPSRAASPSKADSPRKIAGHDHLLPTTNPTPISEGDSYGTKPRPNSALPTPRASFDTFGQPLAPVIGNSASASAEPLEGEA